MASEIRCPNCGQTYALTDEQIPQYSGQTITCTKCQQPFTVPMLMAQSPPPAPAMAGAPGYPPVGPGALGYATPYQNSQQTNGMAIASLVFGLLGFCIPLVSSVAAIVLGILGLQKTRNPNVGGKGLAIAGISLGAISVLLVPCMISILLPSLNRARETANRVKCAANMKSLGQAMLLYANENRGALPPDLATLVSAEDVAASVLVCPSGIRSAPSAMSSAQVAQMISSRQFTPDYVYVGAGMNFGAGADTVLLYEKSSDHGADGGNFLYADGHVDWLPKVLAQKTISQISAGQNPPR